MSADELPVDRTEVQRARLRVAAGCVLVAAFMVWLWLADLRHEQELLAAKIDGALSMLDTVAGAEPT